jgi:hypothetical protein
MAANATKVSKSFMESGSLILEMSHDTCQPLFRKDDEGFIS